MLSRFFILRPIFATVISIVIVLSGAVSQQSLPVAKFPEIAPPTVQVTAFFPGANARIVAETVAQPIEQEVNGVENMLYMSSNSANDGSYVLTVTFNIGADMDMAQVMVQNRVAIAESKLPEEVRRQGITTKKKSTQIVQFVTVYSASQEPGKVRESLFLSNFASMNLRDQLARIEGVGEVQVFGVSDYAMRVWLDPGKMTQRGLTTDDVIAAIREQNVQVAAGQIGAPPAPDGTALQLTINTQGRLATPEQFGEIIVRTGDQGRLTRVKDVATIERGAKDYKYDAGYNGQECAAVAIYQLPGANALSVADKVRALMEANRDTLASNGVAYDIPFDTTRFVTASIAEVYNTLFVAVALVVLVIFIFLQDWRATIVPCAAIPVSLIGTFAVMAVLGFSLNMLTLFGIVLAIGIVVDDAIVVVENTSVHIDRGLAPRDAAITAMNEITGPVIATTLVLLAVFVPTAFMGGITGQLYRQFALTISGAVVISTINALTLSPALCGLLLRPGGASGVKNFILFRWFNDAFDWFTRGYHRVIQLMVRRVAIVMIVFAGLVAATGVGFVQMPKGFMPIEDQGYVFANIQLPDAASLPRTQASMRRFDEILRGTPGVKDWVSVAGYSLITGSSGSNLGMIFIIFEPWDDRTDPAKSQDAILASLRRQFYEVDDSVAFAFTPPAIDGLGAAGGFQLQLTQQGEANYASLQAAAEGIAGDANSQSELRSVNTTFRANVPQLYAEVDRSKAKMKNVPLSTVFGTLQAYLGSAYVNDYNEFGRTFQVQVQADKNHRDAPDDIKQLRVRNADGEMIPLGALLTVEDSFGPQIVQRYQGFPTAQINGEPAPGCSSGDAMTLMDQIAGAFGMQEGQDYYWTGISLQQRQVGSEQYLVFLMAVIFVFLVL
ncbi:MAG: efflux RND transporter permease subunit, partial [Planctomycetales bacterium]|nr:efflux RND transporter permease subunit [Planctomycetales bacterium]